MKDMIGEEKLEEAKEELEEAKEKQEETKVSYNGY